MFFKQLNQSWVLMNPNKYNSLQIFTIDGVFWLLIKRSDPKFSSKFLFNVSFLTNQKNLHLMDRVMSKSNIPEYDHIAKGPMSQNFLQV